MKKPGLEVVIIDVVVVILAAVVTVVTVVAIIVVVTAIENVVVMVVGSALFCVGINAISGVVVAVVIAVDVAVVVVVIFEGRSQFLCRQQKPPFAAIITSSNRAKTTESNISIL